MQKSAQLVLFSNKQPAKDLKHLTNLPTKRLYKTSTMVKLIYIIITIYIMPNMSRSKGNQSMKMSQLIEYNVVK